MWGTTKGWTAAPHRTHEAPRLSYRSSLIRRLVRSKWLVNIYNFTLMHYIFVSKRENGRYMKLWQCWVHCWRIPIGTWSNACWPMEAGKYGLYYRSSPFRLSHKMMKIMKAVEWLWARQNMLRRHIFWYKKCSDPCNDPTIIHYLAGSVLWCPLR